MRKFAAQQARPSDGRKNVNWLDTYALYAAIKDFCGGNMWTK